KLAMDGKNPLPWERPLRWSVDGLPFDMRALRLSKEAASNSDGTSFRSPTICRTGWNGLIRLSTAEQNQAIGRRKSRPLGAAGVERREGVARPEFLACSVGVFVGVSLPFGRGFGRDDSCRRSSRGC